MTKSDLLEFVSKLTDEHITFNLDQDDTGQILSIYVFPKDDTSDFPDEIQNYLDDLDLKRLQELEK